MCSKAESAIKQKGNEAMKFQKKYIVLASLVLALGTAVYINWQLSGNTSTSPAKELGAASYVSATLSNSSTADEAAQTVKLTKEQESYFASERTKRDASQDKIIDDAEELFELEGTAEELKSEAQKDVDEILKRFTLQDSIESIIKAKGFSECLCFISDEGVTVIVPEKELNESSSLVIGDTVTSHYQVDFDNISIVGV